MSLKQRRAPLIGAGIFLLLGIITFAQTSGLDETGASHDPGAAGYPRLLAGTLIVLAMILSFQKDGGEGETTVRGGNALRVVGTIGLLIVYAALMEPLGYILSTSVFLVATMLLMGIRNIAGLIALPVGLSLANFYIFYVAFGVSLPYAFLEGVLS